MRSLSHYIDELRSLDQNNIGSWPTWAYGLAIAVVSLVIMVVAAWYFVLPKRDTLADARHQEVQLKQSFRVKQAKVANLDAYREQLEQMQAEFGKMLAQLPSKDEVPSLLRDVSQKRSGNGLDEELFKPKSDVRRDFYTVLPNTLIVTGDFQHFAAFVSDVAALSRIVTISDVRIQPIGKNRNSRLERGRTELRMSLTASTYRYNGDTTAADADKGKT